MNLIDKHLLMERQESNRHLARSLRLFNKYFLKRHAISQVIDKKKYPDELLKDLNALYNFSSGVIEALENNTTNPPSKTKYQQLELGFNNLPRKNTND